MTYNPLEIGELAASLTRAIEAAPASPLDALPRFKGVGVYALYYRGEFSPYARLASVNGKTARVPIYVGKAVPKGARIGDPDAGMAEKGSKLYSRLQKHLESIRSVKNLDAADFLARWLVVEPVWVPLGESALIRSYLPLWNACVDGFGNNAPGGRREKQHRSEWDTLHPGRPWADKLGTPPTTIAEITAKVKKHLDRHLAR